MPWQLALGLMFTFFHLGSMFGRRMERVAFANIIRAYSYMTNDIERLAAIYGKTRERVKHLL